MNRVTPKSPDEVREILPAYDSIEASFGFVPTSMHVMAHRPPILEGFTQMAGAILGPGVVDAGLKQLVAHVVSRTTGCLYCQAHTGHRAHSLGVDEAKLQAVWEFESDDRFTAAERAALALARESALTPNAVTDAHFEALQEHFDEPQIVEIVAVASLFGYLNRFNDTLANALEPEALAFGAAHLGAIGWEPGKHAE